MATPEAPTGEYSLEDLEQDLGFELPSFGLEDLEQDLGFELPDFAEAASPASGQPAAPRPKKPKIAPAASANTANFPAQQVETLEPPFYSERNASNWEQTAWRYGEVRGDYGLSIRELTESGLGPRYQVHLDSKTDVVMSNIFQVGSRNAVIGYVAKYRDQQDGGGLDSFVARTFYLSKSQGVWRYLPTRNPNWYHKGHSEDSLALPARAQAALGAIQKDKGIHGFSDPGRAERAFAGTTKNIDRILDITYFNEVERKPKKLRGNFYGTNNRAVHPSRVEFYIQSHGDEPDFAANPQIAWEADTDFAKGVKFESVISRNGKYSYVFGRTKEGRAWLCYVQDQSPVQSMGVHENWVDAGDLSMPLVEYAQQAGGYGTSAPEPGVDIKNGYVNMWPRYLKEVPVIQRYLDSRN